MYLWKNKKKNIFSYSVTNYFVVNLSVADLLVTIICMPVAVSQAVSIVWSHGELMCKLSSYLQGEYILCLKNSKKKSNIFISDHTLNLSRCVYIPHCFIFRNDLPLLILSLSELCIFVSLSFLCFFYVLYRLVNNKQTSMTYYSII